MKRADVLTGIGQQRLTLIITDEQPERVVVHVYGERNGIHGAIVLPISDVREALAQVTL